MSPKKKAAPKCPAPSKPLLAYQVDDGDERTEIVFARSSAAARRIGANEIGLDFGEVESCRRVKHFDSFAPGPVPLLVLIEHGWWWECYGCGRQIRCEVYDDASETDISSENAIETDQREIYCSETCRADARANHAARQAVEAAAIAAMVHYLMAGTPIARIERVHGYAFKRSGSFVLKQVVVDFSLPGFPQAGSVRYERDYRQRGGVEVRPRPQIYLSPAAMPSFETYHMHRQIEAGWHRWDDDGGALHPQSEREWAAA